MRDTAQPREFLPVRLWNDKEVRSTAIQIIAMAAILAFLAYLVRNAFVNLEALGKNFSYAFLWQMSSYDINQHLIEYSSRSTHFRAMVVGILNTLLVAVFGIITATVLGFILGVLRLSRNWLTNKLAYAYTEFVRNVPVLLHILLIHGIIVHSLPLPKHALNVGDTLFLTNRGFFVPKPMYEPLFWVVLGISAAGIVFMLWFRKYAKKVQDKTGKHYPVFWIGLAAILGAPLCAYFLLGSPINWDVPDLQRFNFKGGMVVRPEFVALWVALSLYTAAFIGEIVRAGILAVDRGQSEASHALGISRGRTLSLVVIPQALRSIVPPAHQPVREPDQELLAGTRNRVHGHRGHHRRHLPQPDRARDGVHDRGAAVVPDAVAADFRGHELVQPQDPAGGALGSRT